MKFQSNRSMDEVGELAQKLEDSLSSGTKYSGMSYEEGALAMLKFLEGQAEADEIYGDD